MGTRVALVDIDGVLADARHREHWVTDYPPEDRHWAEFFAAQGDDAVYPQGQRLYQELLDQGWQVRYLTGRRESYRRVTTRWLRRNGFDSHPLLMRQPGDRRRLAEVKVAVATRIRDVEGYEVLVVDDDPEVIALAREARLATFQPRWYRKPEALIRRALV